MGRRGGGGGGGDVGGEVGEEGVEEVECVGGRREERVCRREDGL